MERIKVYFCSGKNVLEDNNLGNYEKNIAVAHTATVFEAIPKKVSF